MSVTQEQAEQAYDRVMGGLYEPVFFDKCAQYGRVPRTPHERAAMLRAGAQLYGMHQQALAKEAAARGTILDHAVAHLDQLTGSLAPADDDLAYKSAAVRVLASDPALLQAAALLHEAAGAA